MTIREYLNKCNKHEFISIDGKETSDPEDPFAWHIWQGLPADVPEILKDKEVLIDLWFGDPEELYIHSFEILDSKKTYLNGVTR